MIPVSTRLFQNFLSSVIAEHVFSEAEREAYNGPLAVTQQKDIAAGKRMESRTPRLMMMSGKGGYVDREAFSARLKFRNVTLLDHLTSVTRGAAVFAEIDLREAGIHEDVLPVRLARIMATAFLHDADKMLGLSRSDALTAAHIMELMDRYGISSFLALHGAQIPAETLLARINAVEISRSNMSAPGMKLLRIDEAKDSLYVRLADRLDGIFLDTTRPIGDIVKEMERFEDLQTKAVTQGWTAFSLKSPHTPFLLDELQRAFSVAVYDRKGCPPLIEVHHDGELLLVCQKDVAEEAMEVALSSASKRLRLDLRIEVSARGGRDIMDGGAEIGDLEEAFGDDSREASKALYVHVHLLNDNAWRQVMTAFFGELGFAPTFSGIEKFTGKHFQPWFISDEDDPRLAILRDAASIVMALGCSEPTVKALATQVPDAAVREQELLQLALELGLEAPEWVRETKHQGSRQSLLAAWIAALGARDPDLRHRVFGSDGLLSLWLCGDGSDRAGLFEKIGDPSSRFIRAARKWLDVTLRRRFLDAEVNAPFGYCHFTNAPVTAEAAINSKSGIDGLKVSAFSGREGRPESHESAKSQTLVADFAVAEHRLRTMQADRTGNFAGDIPAHVSSPTAMGLFATLGLSSDLRDTFLDLNHYDLMRLDLKSGRKVYVDRDQYGARKVFARHVSLPARTADLITLIRMMMESALRLGRPVHVFQGMPSTQAGFVYFDILPMALRKAFGGNSLRIEQLPEAIFFLGIAEQLCARDMQNVGLEVALRILDPETRFGATCEAILILDRLPDDRAKALVGLRMALMTIAKKEYAMQAEKGSALIEFARAMARVQAAPKRDASNNELNLGLRIALDTVEGCIRIGETSEAAMVAAIAGQLEAEFERSARLDHRGSFRDGPFPRKAAHDAATVFVTQAWPQTFRSRPPVSKDRRIAFAIYQVSFTEESYRPRSGAETPPLETTEPGK
ncbi:hypothetical protein GCM10011402_32110 [Paracoccus acridae]|uniref:Uncharacterized protein n=1 Tax=Paracoccus acridae TaxID=1795310 RepID=A0ABQ1VL99_9RHOB|nr:hypothetical protein [Paracoccus acridae]GGF76979.1 hypothetical protein GCM10011402_32110 [Paracoccus acridae]